MWDWKTRAKGRVPYAEFPSSGKNSSEDSNSDEYEPNGGIEELFDTGPKGKKNGSKHKKSGSKSQSFSLPKRPAPKTDVRNISMRQCAASVIYSTNSSCLLDPNGNPCRYMPYKQLKSVFLSPEKYLKPDETGINTLLPTFDPVAKNKLQFFGVDDSIMQFRLDDIKAMTDQELLEELEIVEEDLKAISDVPSYSQDFIIVPPYDEETQRSVSIKADVRTFDWERLGQICQFDVIVMDPPWKIQPTNSTRGVELGYEQMPQDEIAGMPIQLVQQNGFLFMWVVASHMPIGVSILQRWGYKIVGHLNWIKISHYGRYKPSNGYYLQHDKETCLVALKGNPPDGYDPDLFNDSIIQQREARQSQKPIELYELVEKMFPNCLYLEIFARAHNIREGWVSIGLEVPD